MEGIALQTSRVLELRQHESLSASTIIRLVVEAMVTPSPFLPGKTHRAVQQSPSQIAAQRK
jgi:hypothetical protein